MKFSESWLRTFVDPQLDTAGLARAFTMAGLEVEALEPAAPEFTSVVVAHVTSLEKHPDADRLKVCRVDVGQAELLQIVCGAPNVHAGARVPCALVGAKLPGIAIKQAKVRGVESRGMLCSAKELGISEQSDGLLLLPSDAPVGQDLRAYLDLNDVVFTLKLTPNRSDCLSVLGVAREAAAVTASNLKAPGFERAGLSTEQSFPVRIADHAACPRYCGRVVRGLDVNAPTPAWMVRRLERSGVRSISAVVDVTNYVMLELGQPLHAFDLEKLNSGIEVRFARQGEKLTLLNQQVLDLTPDMLVITDASGPVAMAGVMGGLDSEVTGATKEVFLESAFFSPAAVAGMARRLGLSSDAAYRFERGVDFAGCAHALERATGLILEICGGSAGPVVEAQGELPSRQPIGLRVARARRVLGIDLDETSVGMLLRRLQFNFVEQAQVYHVTPPSYRFDLEIEEDLIEELARLYGYDHIPAQLPKARLAMLPQPETKRSETALRELLVARDYQEIVSYSFVDAAWEKDLAANEQPVTLRNPIASNMSVMRSTLLPGLVETLRFNLNRKQERVRLFEIGRCFGVSGEGFEQPERIGGLCYGPVEPLQWGSAARVSDFYDVKGDVEALLWPISVDFRPAQHPAFHPGQCAEVLQGQRVLGLVGMLHPRWQQEYDIAGPVGLFELDRAALSERTRPVFSEISKFPPVSRDLALIVDERVSADTLLQTMREALPSSLTELKLFDVYRGKGIDSGKKSLAFRVLLQDTQKTLTDQEVDAAMDHLVRILTERFEIRLRS